MQIESAGDVNNFPPLLDEGISLKVPISVRIFMMDPNFFIDGLKRCKDEGENHLGAFTSFRSDFFLLLVNFLGDSRSRSDGNGFPFFLLSSASDETK